MIDFNVCIISPTKYVFKSSLATRVATIKKKKKKKSGKRKKKKKGVKRKEKKSVLLSSLACLLSFPGDRPHLTVPVDWA